MQRALPEVRSRCDVSFFRMERTVARCFELRRFATLGASVHIMIGAGRVGFELPQILQLMEVGHGLGVPLLGFLGRKLPGAAVHCDLAAQPEIRAAGHMDCAYRKIRVREREFAIARFERCAAAKLKKIRLRSVQNILEAPAGSILLVLTLRECRDSEKTGNEKREKPRNFYVHDVSALELRHTCAVSKDRAGSAQAAASAYFTDSSYVRTILQLVKKQMGFDARRVAHRLPQGSDSRGAAFPIIVRLIQRSFQQPGLGKIVARFFDGGHRARWVVSLHGGRRLGENAGFCNR
jgi:hypothetical protein